jgi:hypothetical protein
VPASVGAATGSGLTASVAVSTVIAGTAGNAAGTGQAAAVLAQVVLGANAGAAAATGLPAGIGSGGVVAGNVGGAVAIGSTAQIFVSSIVPSAVGAAVATGRLSAVALSTIITGKVGAANAATFAASVPNGLPGLLGTASATGLQAGVFTLPRLPGAGGSWGANVHAMRTAPTATSRTVSAAQDRTSTAPYRRSA